MDEYDKAKSECLDILVDMGVHIPNEKKARDFLNIKAPQAIRDGLLELKKIYGSSEKTALQRLLSNNRVFGEIFRGLWVPITFLAGLGMCLSTFLIYHDKPYMAILFSGITNLAMFLIVIAIVFSRLNKLKG